MLVVTSYLHFNSRTYYPDHNAIFNNHKLITNSSHHSHKRITNSHHNHHTSKTITKAIMSWLAQQHIPSMWYVCCSCKYAVWAASQLWSQTHHKVITTQSQKSQTFVITNFNPSPVWNPYTFEPPLYLITSRL